MATYKQLRSTTISGQAGTTWYVQLWKKDYLGSSSEMTLSGEGFSVNWSGQGGTRDKQFLNSECVLNMYAQNSTDEDLIYDIFSKGDRNYYIRIYKNGESNADIWWFGWVNPSFSKIENVSFPYRVNIKATDSIGTFSKQSESSLSESEFSSSFPVNNIIKDFGDSMGVYHSGILPTNNPAPCPTNNDWFQTSVDWWASESTYNSNDPFNLYRISKLPFRKDPEKFPNKYFKYDVLKESLKTFGTTCVLSNGTYNFIQPNSYKGSTSGVLPFYSYQDGDEGSETKVDKTNLLELDGTTNSNKGVVMQGSVLTYEPPFKSVSAKFKNGNANILIHPNGNYSSYGFVGNLQQDPSAADDAYISWQLNLYFLEVLVQSAVDAIIPSNQTLRKEYFNTKFTWNIKIDNGTTIYYLTHNPNSDKYHWVTSEPNNINYAGYLPPTNSNPLQYAPYNSNSQATIPCNMYIGSGADYLKRYVNTSMALGITSDLPPITGSVSVELNAENIYYSWQDTGTINGEAFYRGGLDTTVFSQERYFYPPSTVTDSNSISINDEGEGVIYFSEQTDNVSEENFEFKELMIGSSGSSTQESNNVQYLDSNSISLSVSEGFRRGSSGGFDNITQLLCSEFLSLQSEPLEILQADVFSSDISPLKLIKYSIDNNSSFKYYTFLGGKFSAQSETMSGEWYKVNSTTPTITEQPEVIKFQRGDNQSNQTELLLDNLKSDTTTALIEASLGVLSVAISSGVATTSITLGSSLKGDIAQNQNLKLTMPNGTKAKTIVVLTGKNSSANSFNTDSFTTDIDYPIGSIISISPYETVGLMQSLVSSGNVNFRASGSDNIQEMNFLPHDFNLTSNPSVGVASADLGGSIQIASATANMYAQKLISKGKTITKVNVFASSNLDYRVYEGFIFNDTTTLVGTGVANTELDITDIVGTSRNYITIQIDVDSASEKVYGGYALVTNT